MSHTSQIYHTLSGAPSRLAFPARPPSQPGVSSLLGLAHRAPGPVTPSLGLPFSTHIQPGLRKQADFAWKHREPDTPQAARPRKQLWHGQVCMKDMGARGRGAAQGPLQSRARGTRLQQRRTERVAGLEEAVRSDALSAPISGTRVTCQLCGCDNQQRQDLSSCLHEAQCCRGKRRSNSLEA